MMVFNVDTDGALRQVKRLWLEYAEHYASELGDQDLAAEADALPTGFQHPTGALLAAMDDGVVHGVVGVKKRDAATCEMKRLFVAKTARGTGVGRKLANAAIREGKRLGYVNMWLDTSETMVEAQALYASIGFEVIEGDSSPCRAPVYMQKRL
ncbi:MAG: GNAT family N-acetyltransferase [Thermoplasmatota archaeon]